MLTRRRFFGLLAAALLVRPPESPVQRNPISIALGNTWIEALRVQGYAQGGMVHEPTLLVGMTRGPYAIAGERGFPEWVSPGRGSYLIQKVSEEFDRLIEKIRAERVSA